MRSRIITLALLVFLVGVSPGDGNLEGAEPALPGEATIYYNEACGACARYIRETLLPLLQRLGFKEIALKDFINHPEYRGELVSRSEDLGIPADLQGHFTAFLGEKVILQGHVPVRVIRDLFRPENEHRYERIVVLQDVMSDHGGTPREYTVWALGGAIETYGIETPIATYLDRLQQDAQQARSTAASRRNRSLAQLLPFVLVTGLLDGINPCAIAVLLFFIAFMFTLQRARAEMFLMGGVYISMIYAAYLGIGLGLMGAIVISGVPHLMAQIGSWLLIALGLVNVKDYFWYGRGPTLGISHLTHHKAQQWLKRATLPAAAVSGFLVGLCTFPCTGGIYVAVLGLLSSKTAFWTGFSYLLLYNAMFVLPLVILLLALGNRRTVGALSRWEARNKRAIKLATGALMIGLGSSILIWFV